jgi:hypothetical protein
MWSKIGEESKDNDLQGEEKKGGSGRWEIS